MLEKVAIMKGRNSTGTYEWAVVVDAPTWSAVMHALADEIAKNPGILSAIESIRFVNLI